MNLKSRFIILAFLWSVSSLAASEPEQPPVELPLFRVESSYSEVRFGARFRYHVPGKALKALTLKKVPRTWSDKGLAAGDWVVGVDDVPIDGMGIVAVAQMIEKKTGSPMVLDIRSEGSKDIRKVEVLFKKDSGDMIIQYP